MQLAINVTLEAVTANRQVREFRCVRVLRHRRRLSKTSLGFSPHAFRAAAAFDHPGGLEDDALGTKIKKRRRGTERQSDVKSSETTRRTTAQHKHKAQAHAQAR